jgi:hypothetical protein
MSRLPPTVERFLDEAYGHLKAIGHASEATAAIANKRAAMSAWFESNLYIDEWEREVAVMRLPLPITERLRRLGELTEGYRRRGLPVRVSGLQ